MSTLVIACDLGVTRAEMVPFAPSDVQGLFRVRWVGASGFSGHAFLIDRGSQPAVALTAFHVAAGVPVTSTPSGAEVVTGILQHPVEADVTIRLGARIHIPGARTISADDSQHDIAAFHAVDRQPSRMLRLAAHLPAAGDTVSVLAVHIGDGTANQHPFSGPRRHIARVESASGTDFRYTYLLSANANFTSGAAVLDKNGDVVAINVGTVVRNGAVIGVGVGVGSIRAQLP